MKLLTSSFISSTFFSFFFIQHLIFLIIFLLPTVFSQSYDQLPLLHQQPTNSPTISYHFKNSVFFEALSIIALILMIIVLIIGFFGDCFGFMCPRTELGTLDPRNFGRESTRESLNKYSIEFTTKFSIKETPIELIQKVQKCLDIYTREWGDKSIPSDWKVPTTNPWPPELWGFNFGHHLNSLCGTSALLPSRPISQGKPAKSSLFDNENHADEHETWYELFYDLVFVASAIQLGTVIKYDHRLLGMAKASVLFLMLRSTWDHLTLYQNR